MNRKRLVGLVVLAILALSLVVFPMLTAAKSGGGLERSSPGPNLAQLQEGVMQIEYPPSLANDLYEPNDDPQSAAYIGYNDFRNGLIDPAGDVDYYAFYGYPGDTIYADIDASEAGSPLDPTLTLYDVDGVTELAYDDDSDPDLDSRINYTLQSEGYFFLKVAAFAHPSVGGEDYFYWLFLSLSDPYEPNNRVSRATPINIGDEVMANISPTRDVDFYRFDGQAGETLIFDIDAISIGSWLTPVVTLYGYNGSTVLIERSYFDAYSDPSFTYTLPADGPYYVRVGGYFTAEGGPQYFYNLRVERPQLLVSPTVTGKVNGISFAPGDILANELGSDNWEMYFDGSDVGVKGNLNAFDLTDENCLLLSFGSSQKLDIYGFMQTIQPQDIVRFCPYSLGNDTWGYFDWYFDGSDVGLTTAGGGDRRDLPVQHLRL